VAATRELLAGIGHEPKRSLGQNFLLDPALAALIVSSLEVAAGDLVCEIGPGAGALTGPLANISDPDMRILTLEKDRALATYLRRCFSGDPRVNVIEADAMEWDWRLLCGPRRVLLLGNLPYNISTAVLQKFGRDTSPVQRMVLTVQKEVAARVCAHPGGKEYGAFSVLVQRFWKPDYLRTLPPEVFYPQPKVDSALIRLDRRPHREIGRCDGTSLENFLHRGFGQRRKQLRKLLGCSETQWRELAGELDFRPEARAEDLSPEQWQSLAARLDRDSLDHSPPDSEEIFDVVDENDHVMESLPRGEVHARSMRHRAAHILLRNRAGEIFLQKRAPWKEINPGVWDSSAAGHMAAGETYEGAAHRELLEELGVDTPLRRLGKLTPCADTGEEFIEVFLGEHEGPFQLAGLEITGGAFFSPERIREWATARPRDFSPVFLLCLPLLDRAG